MKRPASPIIALFLVYALTYTVSGFFNVVHGENGVLLNKVQDVLENVGIPQEEFEYRPNGTKFASSGINTQPTSCSIYCEDESGDESLSITCMDGFVATCECTSGADLAVGECNPKEAQ
jgi:hypothetical protein